MQPHTWVVLDISIVVAAADDDDGGGNDAANLELQDAGFIHRCDDVKWSTFASNVGSSIVVVGDLLLRIYTVENNR